MSGPKISDIKAREILDSKGVPMVEVDVLASDGSVGRGSSPCGVSVGSHEAVVIRDGDHRYQGLGVRQAAKNVIDVILPALRGEDVCQQQRLDRLMIELDATADKSKLGANAICSVSIALARAAAAGRGIPLYRHLNDCETYSLPLPVFNMINGGTYGDRKIDFQEFLLLPAGAASYPDALRMGVEIFCQLDKIIVKRYGRPCLQIGKGAGWAAPVNEPAQILELLLEAARSAGYADDVKVGIDCAASHFFDRTAGCYRLKEECLPRSALIALLKKLAETYPLCLIEDPLDEDDFEGHALLTQNGGILIAGDDLFVTNVARLKKGVQMGAANAIVIKPNMVGTLSEALETVAYAKAHGYWIIPGGRAGGSVDDPVTDLAVAAGAPLVKFGAPRAGEKINKYNRLLQIQDDLGTAAHFPDFIKLLCQGGTGHAQKDL
jgi:enolase